MSEHLGRVLSGLEGGLKVADIASEPLRFCFTDDLVSTVRSWAGPMTINNVPVRRGPELIGVLENINGDITTASVPDSDSRVRDAMRPLAQDMLVEGREPLRLFLGELLQPPYYRLVLRDRKIDAIVTPSDANKLPVRLVAFTMVVHLEKAMLDVARREAEGDDEAAVRRLSQGGYGQVAGLQRTMRERKLNVSLLDVTNLEQKAEILVAQGVFPDPEAAQADFSSIYEQLRNPLMHGSAYVSDSLESLAEFTENLQRVVTRTEQLEAVLAHL